MKVCISLCAMLLFTGCDLVKEEALYRKHPACYSYIIGDVQGDRTYKEHRADLYVTPASTLKSVTALLGLKVLGKEYRYNTDLLVTSSLKKSVVLSFSGDPTFTFDHLLELLKPLAGQKIGDILLDASIFKTSPYSENIMVDDVGTDYGQPVFGITIDKNLITVSISPLEEREDFKTTIDVPYEVASTVAVSDTSDLNPSWRGDFIEVKGKVNPKEEGLRCQLSPKRIDEYILKKVQKALDHLKIQGGLKIVYDKEDLPSDLRRLNRITSPPLKELLPPALKTSDNLVFDALYLTLIHLKGKGDIKEWGDGNKVIKELVKTHFGIDMQKARIVDGSGLSRYNRIQPRALYSLLKKGFSVEGFIEALAFPLEEGTTLRKRTHLPRTIRAKTGTMSGITALCGYHLGKKPKVFVMVASHFAPPSKEVTRIIDPFITKVLGLKSPPQEKSAP